MLKGAVFWRGIYYRQTDTRSYLYIKYTKFHLYPHNILRRCISVLNIENMCSNKQVMQTLLFCLFQSLKVNKDLLSDNYCLFRLTYCLPIDNSNSENKSIYINFCLSTNLFIKKYVIEI